PLDWAMVVLPISPAAKAASERNPARSVGVDAGTRSGLGFFLLRRGGEGVLDPLVQFLRRHDPRLAVPIVLVSAHGHAAHANPGLLLGGEVREGERRGVYLIVVSALRKGGEFVQESGVPMSAKQSDMASLSNAGERGGAFPLVARGTHWEEGEPCQDIAAE